MKVYLFTFLFALFTITTSAATYTFIGNGNWGASSNWENGLVPPLNIPSGSTIIVNGNAQSSSVNPGIQLYLIPENVTLIISTGFTLSLTLDKDFNMNGAMVVQGTFNDNFASFISGTVTLSGRYNTGIVSEINTITVANGGSLYNTGYLSIYHMTIETGGNFINTGKAFGNGTILGSFQNSGILAPGSSPGVYDISGDYTANLTAIHNFEVAGTSSGEFDRLLVGGNLNLNGTLNVSLINGFTPTTNHDLTIMTGTVSGTFSTVNIPASYSIIYNSSSIVLRFLQSLPVEFINFVAKREGNSVKLHWEVGTETDVARYEVERSEDGIRFNKIGFLNASGQSSYSFTDRQVVSKVFYRIRSVDMDGTNKYSSIIKIDDGKTHVLLSAFPLPAKNQLQVQHSTADLKSKINLYSIDGKILMTVIPKTSNQQTTIDVSNLRAGMYLLSYENDKSREILKFVKQ